MGRSQIQIFALAPLGLLLISTRTHAQAPNPPAPPASTQRYVLPEGVEKIYALEGDNSLVVFATPEGYRRVMEILRGLGAIGHERADCAAPRALISPGAPATRGSRHHRIGR